VWYSIRMKFTATVKNYTVAERAQIIYQTAVEVFDYNATSEVVTPFQLAEEQVKNLANPDSTYLIPGAGIGTYAAALIKHGATPSNIYCVELSRSYCYLGKAIFGRFGVHYINTDFLTWNPEMQFDVIVGNPPYSDRSKVSGANTGGCANNLDSGFFLQSMEIADRVSFIIRAKHFIKFSSKFRKKLFGSGNLVSFKYLPPEIFPTVQNTQTCIVTWDKNHKGPCKITYKDGSVVERNLSEKDLIKLDNPEFIEQVPDNLAHRYFNGNIYRNAIKDVQGGAPIVEILGSGETPKIRYIEPGLEETGRDQYGVIMNMAAEWGGLGKVMIKPYEASVTFSVVFLKTSTNEEAVILRDYLMSNKIKEFIKINMASFHPTKDLFRKITDPLAYAKSPNAVR